MAVDVQLRILALTATPGCKSFINLYKIIFRSHTLNPYIKCIYSAKQLTIQQIIDNLQISTLEYRNESDHDVLPYVHDRKIELIEVHPGLYLVKYNVQVVVLLCI